MRKVFVSYYHRLDKAAADKFRTFFSDERDVFIDKSIRVDVGANTNRTIKKSYERSLPTVQLQLS